MIVERLESGFVPKLKGNYIGRLTKKISRALSTMQLKQILGQNWFVKNPFIGGWIGEAPISLQIILMDEKERIHDYAELKLHTIQVSATWTIDSKKERMIVFRSRSRLFFTEISSSQD